MAEAVQPPRTADEVLDWLEQGRLSPAEAFAIFRTLDQDRRASNQLRVAVRESPREQDPEEARRQRLQQALADLDALIGLESVKELVREVQAFVEIQQRRSKARLATEPMALHMIFKGNPGTGKTTVARIFGRMFEAMGVLPKGHLVECERADLVGEYIGHTAQKTREQIRQALGGILFIDEAYSLARGGEKDFGKEAIDTLVKAMEDKKDQLVLILAGYRREMELFLQTNPGLRSRFPIQIDFPDYKTAELLQIADLMLKQREYRLTEGARRRLHDMLEQRLRSGDPHLGNARMVRNIIERAIRRQAVRLIRRPQISRNDLMLITEADIEEVSVAR
ncbi:MAG TPA: AAA family ATPase [Limnochordia bacterium]|nr:AAA family ATPase [Limnochordia bacterium]